MTRPKRRRRIRFSPDVTYYKPQGVPASLLKQIDLEDDELEAMRLSNIDGLKMDEASKKMTISKATFQRILSSAHKKVSDALVNGKAIKILTNINMPNRDGTGPQGKGPKTGRGMGPCDDKDNSQQDQRPRRGCGRGRGRGNGRNRAF